MEKENRVHGVLEKWNNKTHRVEYYPTHRFANNWTFDENSYEEAMLAQSVAENAEKNGLGINDAYTIFPLILRMLKSKNVWAE